MVKQTAIKFFCFIFLSIFFCKMVISVSPLILGSFDSKSIFAVIMQLEIENHTEKESSEKIKEALLKGEWLIPFEEFKFTQPSLVSGKLFFLSDIKVTQSFYPSVPTPPPSI